LYLFFGDKILFACERESARKCKSGRIVFDAACHDEHTDLPITENIPAFVTLTLDTSTAWPGVADQNQSAMPVPCAPAGLLTADSIVERGCQGDFDSSHLFIPGEEIKTRTGLRSDMCNFGLFKRRQAFRTSVL
jgi:hypothetical protein